MRLCRVSCAFLTTAMKFARRQMSFAVVRAETDFHGELRAGDLVVLKSTVVKVGDKSATFRHRLTKRCDGKAGNEHGVQVRASRSREASCDAHPRRHPGGGRPAYRDVRIALGRTLDPSRHQLRSPLGQGPRTRVRPDCRVVQDAHPARAPKRIGTPVAWRPRTRQPPMAGFVYAEARGCNPGTAGAHTAKTRRFPEDRTQTIGQGILTGKQPKRGPRIHVAMGQQPKH